MLFNVYDVWLSGESGKPSITRGWWKSLLQRSHWGYQILSISHFSSHIYALLSSPFRRLRGSRHKCFESNFLCMNLLL